jgi:hypothetical protein
MPKSGSTWLTAVLESSLGLNTARCYLEADRNEQEIDPTIMFQSWGKKTLFVQQHVRFSKILLKICAAFSTKIVVLTRRLEDVVISLRDHINNESSEFSMFYMENEWIKALSPSEQIDFIIDHAMPWYINFYLGWSQAEKEYKDQILMVRYENIVNDSAKIIFDISKFYGQSIKFDLSALEIKKENLRFNKGRVGRGKEVLTKNQHKRLMNLRDYYPGVDFEAIGL